ncbi:MAG: hypothetical protein KDK04_24430 [Candidatus Competibacteraceae bacterium]|nr:hypothetical protein [Candidatus Competibacteraceae bacterium]MCB1814838.1 hypothetical protein [Candidatus Competibacteraceae bacterium]
MLAEVLTAFTAATGLNALNLAGLMVLLSAAVGGVLVLGWLFRTGHEAARGGWIRAPQSLLLSVAAFIVLLAVLGALYS